MKSLLRNLCLLAVVTAVGVALCAGTADAKKKKKAADSTAAAAAAPAGQAAAAAPAKAKGKAAGMAGKMVDLNTASQKDLQALPGVGAATAKKIIANRPYASAADLAKAGVPQKTIDKISGMVTAGQAATTGAAATAKGAATTAKSTAGAAAAGGKQTAQTAAAQAAPPAGSGQVWVNLDSKVYHYEGTRWYGKTKNGKYMSEKDAIAAGYRATKEKEKATK